MNIHDKNFKPTINEELQSFLPEHTSDELEQLTENCKADPDHELMPPVQIWSNDDSIIDGHHQYKIRNELGLTIKYAERNFDSIGDVMQDMIRIQFGRRNLNASQRAMLVAKARRYAPGRPNSEARSLGRSLDELAAMAGVSKRQVSAAAKVEDKGASSVIHGVANGKFSVADAASIVELPKDQQEQIANHALANGATLSNAKSLVVRKPGRGQEFVPAKLLKAATYAFGVLMRQLDKLGIGDECGEHMDAILAAINNCEDRRDEENKVPF